MIQTNIK